MIPSVLHHTQASSAVRAAQMTAVGLSVVAAALVVLGPSGGERAVPELRMPEARVKPVLTQPEKPATLVDTRALADRFAQLGNSPKPKPVEPEPAPESGPAPVVAEDSVRYLGSLTEPGRRLALLKVSERQRLVAAGETIESLRVVEVGPDFAIVEDGAGQRRLTKGERQGPAITYLSGGVPSAVPSSFNPGVATGAVAAARAAGRARSMGTPGHPPPGQITTTTNVPRSPSETTGDQNP